MQIIFFDECESIFVSRDKVQGKVNLLLTGSYIIRRVILFLINKFSQNSSTTANWLLWQPTGIHIIMFFHYSIVK